MTRLLKLVTIIFAIISLTSAQVVDTLNTPLGPVTQGANVPVTWTLIAGVDATGKTGDLSATDSVSKNTIPINNAVPLAPKSFSWNVQVPPGTYVLGLNDGSGLKQSGEVVVKAPPGGGPVPPPPSSAAPAPSGGAAPAPAPAPPAGSSAAGSSAAGGAAASTPTAGGAGGADGSSTTPTGVSGSATTPSSVSSASSIFSGYGIVFSLLGVAIAMVQF